jgi:hypothetical protein
MWSMNTYWRFENRNGGVYLQCEAITLTRSIPVALRWLIEPYITSFPRESLTENYESDTRFSGNDKFASAALMGGRQFSVSANGLQQSCGGRTKWHRRAPRNSAE